MSPELDLLERLSAEDASLYEAAFGSCYHFRDLTHAQKVVVIYLQAGCVELYDHRSNPPDSIPFHTGRWILADVSNWERDTHYWLRLTAQGCARFTADSAGFFDALFS